MNNFNPNKKDKKFELNEGKKDIMDLLSSDQIENYIKSLSSPSFLGSIHLKKGTTPKARSIENLLKGELESKVNKSIKGSIFNPITKILIGIVIAFNIIWFTLLYFF
ncbi:MAG: hypothetical protein P8Y70_03040 [Candidatus Lokiarchaeota archaeon]